MSIPHISASTKTRMVIYAIAIIENYAKRNGYRDFAEFRKWHNSCLKKYRKRTINEPCKIIGSVRWVKKRSKKMKKFALAQNYIQIKKISTVVIWRKCEEHEQSVTGHFAENGYRWRLVAFDKTTLLRCALIIVTPITIHR